MNTLFINEKPYLIPSKWDELNKKQLIKMAWLSVTTLNTGNLKKIAFLVLTMHLSLMEKIRFYFFYFVQSNLTEKADMLKFVDSFTKSGNMSIQKIPLLRYKNVLLQGPKDGLSNSCLYEFIEAESHFYWYMSNNKEEHLDALISVLYRPIDKRKAKTSLDRRIPLEEFDTSSIKMAVSKIDRHTKLAIMIWFDGCRMNLYNQFPNLFSKNNTERKTPINPAFKLLDMVMSKATSLESVDKFAYTNLYTAFAYLDHEIKTQQKC